MINWKQHSHRYCCTIDFLELLVCYYNLTIIQAEIVVQEALWIYVYDLKGDFIRVMWRKRSDKLFFVGKKSILLRDFGRKNTFLFHFFPFFLLIASNIIINLVISLYHLLRILFPLGDSAIRRFRQERHNNVVKRKVVTYNINGYRLYRICCYIHILAERWSYIF